MRIVVLDGGVLNPGDMDWGPLEELGELTVYKETAPEEVANRARGAEIVLVNKTPLREDLAPSLGDCKMVGVLATGYNNLDLPSLSARGIVVCNTPDYGAADVAEHALALILELARNTRLHTESVLAGEWQKRGEWCYWLKTPLALHGKTLGVVGFGGVGRALGKIASAMGMKVLASARRRDAVVDYPFEYADLDSLLTRSDVISLHCPLTPETDKIINAERLAKIRDGALLINTARGGLVDEGAVADALSNGKLAGYGADVLSVEPPNPDNPLPTAPNVLLTPHIAWATAEARQKIIDITGANVRAFIEGKPINVVNKDLLNN